MRLRHLDHSFWPTKILLMLYKYTWVGVKNSSVNSPVPIFILNTHLASGRFQHFGQAISGLDHARIG